MDLKQFIDYQMGVSRRYVDATMQDLTEELVNWTPPGSANSIGVTLLHIAAGEDFVINRVVQGKPSLWEAGGWGQKVGTAAPPVGPGSWEEVKAAHLALAPLQAYIQEARAATDAYLANITPDAFDRKVNFVHQDRPVGEVLAMTITHASHHAGEIAALKGVQGCPGLPF